MLSTAVIFSVIMVDLRTPFTSLEHINDYFNSLLSNNAKNC